MNVIPLKPLWSPPLSMIQHFYTPAKFEIRAPEGLVLAQPIETTTTKNLNKCYSPETAVVPSTLKDPSKSTGKI